VLLDRETHAASVHGQPVPLTPTEFDLLGILMSSPGRVFPRSELLQHLRGVTFQNIERTMDVHIRNLRTKIEPDPSKPIYIETVFGVGYRFRPE
jgi:DNA-binding response OmpR family regulator